MEPLTPEQEESVQQLLAGCGPVPESASGDKPIPIGPYGLVAIIWEMWDYCEKLKAGEISAHPVDEYNRAIEDVMQYGYTREEAEWELARLRGGIKVVIESTRQVIRQTWEAKREAMRAQKKESEPNG